MAWGQPKRNVKNICGHRGACACERARNAHVRDNAADMPRTCTKTCQPSRGRHAACGAKIRSGVCPCPYC